MTKYKLEYIWLDGYTPVPNLRGKTQIKEFEKFPTLEQLPLWGFDGSSTLQAEGHNSDCVLKPVAVYPDGARTNGVLVMCEVMMPDGKTPHASNKRATILDDEGAWFGFEQEYFFYKDGRPLGFPIQRLSRHRRARTTPASATRMSATLPARWWTSISTSAWLPASTMRASTPKSPRASGNSRFSARVPSSAADEMWMARYLMLRLTEKYGVDIEFHCKPLGDTDWNGSGMHANFSTKYMREVGGKDYFEKLMEAFKTNRADHIAVYGPDNHLRLTGKHETASIDDVQLRHRRSRRLDPRAAQLRQQRLQGLSGRPSSELARRPLPDRFADPEDHRFRPGRQGGGGLRDQGHGLDGGPGRDIAFDTGPPYVSPPANSTSPATPPGLVFLCPLSAGSAGARVPCLESARSWQLVYQRNHVPFHATIPPVLVRRDWFDRGRNRHHARRPASAAGAVGRPRAV